MKKYVLTFSLVLLLLVSCATKKTEQEIVPESVETTVIEQLPASVPVTEEIPQTSETEEQVPSATSEEAATETEVPAAEEVTASTDDSVSSEAPVTDWGYVFTSPSTAEAEKPQETKTAEALKSNIIKPASSETAKQTAVETKKEEVVKTSFFTKVAYFFAHETLFSLGLIICISGLVYFIIALVKSSGMIEKKKKVQVKEEVVVEETPTDHDVEPKDNLSSDFDSEAEKDEFLRALLGEHKK